MSTIAIIAPSAVPFQIGGAEKFWWGLHKGLSEYSGAYVELLKMPSREQTFAEIVGSYRMFSGLDLSYFDMVISSKYPAWMVRHPKHVVYMQHTLRGLYDIYHFTGLPETLEENPPALRELLVLIRKPEPNREDLGQAFEMLDRVQQSKSLSSALFAFPGPLIREVVHFFDRVALHPSHIAAYATISETVRIRRDYFPEGVNVKILHHPSDILEYVNRSGEYIFTASRLTNMKRVDMIVEAMRHVTVDIPLKIAGTGSEIERLRALAGADRRIEFLGYVPDAALPELYSRALFVPFVPYDEDYGLITIEAMRTGKPVVTVRDAGGVCEFVTNGKTGYCTEPTPEALGAAMQRLAEAPEHARELGRNAQKLVKEITWENITSKLLGHVADSEVRRLKQRSASGLPKVLVCSTFPASKPVSGGQRRLHQLCKALTRRFFVQLLCLGGREQQYPEYEEVMPDFQEIRLPWSSALVAEERDLEERTSASVGDLACLRTCGTDPDVLRFLRACGEDAALVIAAHPYLYPAVQAALPDVSLVYDAHNVEADMKTVILDGCPSDEKELAAQLLAQVRDVEQACCLEARQVLVCSNADAERFAALYGLLPAQMRVVPNGFDDSDIAFADSATRRSLRKRIGFPDTFTALFVGSWHRPNLEAVEHILRMAPEFPDIQFFVAGTVCRAFEAVPSNVHLLGEIAESIKNTLLRAVNISLNPVTSGAGTNLKIIESVACGLETLSTPHGLRGLDDERFTAGVRVGEIPSFPALIRQAMQHPLSDDNLSRAACSAREHFSWRASMSNIPETLSALVQDKGNI